jgi:hypothetical protein
MHICTLAVCNYGLCGMLRRCSTGVACERMIVHVGMYFRYVRMLMCMLTVCAACCAAHLRVLDRGAPSSCVYGYISMCMYVYVCVCMFMYSFFLMQNCFQTQIIRELEFTAAFADIPAGILTWFYSHIIMPVYKQYRYTHGS